MQQKQRNDLVFKLLKSMNPFFTDKLQTEQLRTHINNALTSSVHKSLLFDSERSLQTITEQSVTNQIARVINIKINGGKFSNPHSSSKVLKMQKNHNSNIGSNKESIKTSRLIRDELSQIQAQTFKRFNIAPSYLDSHINEKKCSAPVIDVMNQYKTLVSTQRPYRHQIHSSTIGFVQKNVSQNNLDNFRLEPTRSTLLTTSISQRSLFKRQKQSSECRYQKNHRSLHKPSSQKIIKQSHRLDVSIFSSFLSRKIHSDESKLFA